MAMVFIDFDGVVCDPRVFFDPPQTQKKSLKVQGHPKMDFFARFMSNTEQNPSMPLFVLLAPAFASRRGKKSPLTLERIEF